MAASIPALFVITSPLAPVRMGGGILWKTALGQCHASKVAAGHIPTLVTFSLFQRGLSVIRRNNNTAPA